MATFAKVPPFWSVHTTTPGPLTMTGNLRYVFEGRNAIVDRSDSRKRWSTTPAFTEDYAIVSRVLKNRHHGDYRGRSRIRRYSGRKRVRHQSAVHFGVG